MNKIPTKVTKLYRVKDYTFEKPFGLFETIITDGEITTIAKNIQLKTTNMGYLSDADIYPVVRDEDGNTYILVHYTIK